MTTNDTNGYLPYDDDTFEQNLGYEPARLDEERDDSVDDGHTLPGPDDFDELFDVGDDFYDEYDLDDLDDIYFDATPEPPKPNMTVWGTPQRQTELKVEITGIGNGFTATAAVYIDNGDDAGNGALLYAATVANPDCDVEHALNELAPNAVSITGAWLKANEEGVELYPRVTQVPAT